MTNVRLLQIRTAGLALALCAASAAHAVDDAAFARCRGIFDSAARLACYDGLPLARTPSDAQPPPIAPSRPAAAPPSASAPVVSAPSAPAPRVAASAAAPAPPPPPQAQVQSFGMEERVARAEQPTTMESFIPGHFEGWGPGARIKLGNGQVWQVVDGTSAFMNVDNPKVVVRRGMMGGFFLELENSNRSPRVRRLQ
jgi:hypothetical protein